MEKTKKTEVNKMWNPGWDNGPEKKDINENFVKFK